MDVTVGLLSKKTHWSAELLIPSVTNLSVGGEQELCHYFAVLYLLVLELKKEDLAVMPFLDLGKRIMGF